MYLQTLRVRAWAILTESVHFVFQNFLTTTSFSSPSSEPTLTKISSVCSFLEFWVQLLRVVPVINLLDLGSFPSLLKLRELAVLCLVTVRYCKYLIFVGRVLCLFSSSTTLYRSRNRGEHQGHVPCPLEMGVCIVPHYSWGHMARPELHKQLLQCTCLLLYVVTSMAESIFWTQLQKRLMIVIFTWGHHVYMK